MLLWKWRTFELICLSVRVLQKLESAEHSYTIVPWPFTLHRFNFVVCTGDQNFLNLFHCYSVNLDKNFEFCLWCRNLCHAKKIFWNFRSDRGQSLVHARFNLFDPLIPTNESPDKALGHLCFGKYLLPTDKFNVNIYLAFVEFICILIDSIFTPRLVIDIDRSRVDFALSWNLNIYY